jgi:hypothetical protein
LQDLTFIEDGNLLYLENGHINFAKCRLIATSIQEMLQYQQEPYNLTPVDCVMDYFESLPALPEPDLYAQSKVVEPKLG